MIHKAPEGHEKKSASVKRICAAAIFEGSGNILITHPQALGDNYDEVIESLSLLADAELRLQIMARKEPDRKSNKDSKKLPNQGNIYHFKD